MQNRGLTPSVIEEAIKSGTPSLNKEPGRLQIYDSINNITVIIEGERVVTAIPGRLK